MYTLIEFLRYFNIFQLNCRIVTWTQWKRYYKSIFRTAQCSTKWLLSTSFKIKSFFIIMILFLLLYNDNENFLQEKGNLKEGSKYFAVQFNFFYKKINCGERERKILSIYHPFHLFFLILMYCSCLSKIWRFGALISMLSSFSWSIKEYNYIERLKDTLLL